MSLAINSMLEYLQQRLNIPASRMMDYYGKSVKEIVQAESDLGNAAAIQLAAEMFTDPARLIELFQLADPENKLTIMKAMTSSQLEHLIPLLETKDMVQGLKFFTTESLMDLLEDIPKKELVKTVFQMFSQEQIIGYMPEGQLNKILTGVEMDKDALLENLKSIPEMYLSQIIESVTGQPAEGNASDMVLQIGQLGDLAYKHAITNLQPEQKQQLTLALASSDNKLYERFDSDAYTHIIKREREKNEIVQSMGVIKDENLQKMMEKLPPDILSIVITQVDTEKFAHILITQFPELLAQFIAG